MVGSVNAFHSRELEVPLEAGAGVCERRNEATACSIDMYRDIYASLLLVRIENVGDSTNQSAKMIVGGNDEPEMI